MYVSIIEIVCILNILTAKEFLVTKEKQIKVTISKLKEISEVCIPYLLIHLHFISFIQCYSWCNKKSFRETETKVNITRLSGR